MIGWRISSSRTEFVRSCCAAASLCRRGWVSSGRMRLISMTKAPLKRWRPSVAEASMCVSDWNGSDGTAENVRSAACVAASLDPLEPALHFVGESAGGVGGAASGSVDG